MNDKFVNLSDDEVCKEYVESLDAYSQLLKIFEVTLNNAYIIETSLTEIEKEMIDRKIEMKNEK